MFISLYSITLFVFPFIFFPTATMATQQFSELDEIVDAVSFGQVRRTDDLDDVDEAVKYEVTEMGKRKGKVSKHHKLKMTLFWVLLWLSIVLLIVLVLLVVVYESGLSSAALTAPLWIAWDISPGT